VENYLGKPTLNGYNPFAFYLPLALMHLGKKKNLPWANPHATHLETV
jgi:hypothetical protein